LIKIIIIVVIVVDKEIEYNSITINYIIIIVALELICFF